MRNISKLIVLLLIMCSALFAREKIDNIQFKDLDGNSYDLYQLLGKGHYVFIHMQFNA